MPDRNPVSTVARPHKHDSLWHLMKFEFNTDKCREAREALGRDKGVSDIWMRQFSPKTSIGLMSELYRKLSPTSPEDFYEKYVAYAEENHHLPIPDRGLTYEELLMLTGAYRQASLGHSLVTYSPEMYFYDALCHIILETWEGQQNEREFSLFLNKLGYKTETFDGNVDALYGLDIKVTRNDGKVSAIQIKPISFFTSKRPDVVEHRRLLCKKYEKAYTEMNGLKTYYAVYHRDKATGEVTWIKNGNGFRFKINELFIYDPRNIDGTFHDKGSIRWDSPRGKLEV